MSLMRMGLLRTARQVHDAGQQKNQRSCPMNVRRANFLATAALVSACLAGPAAAAPIFRLDATSADPFVSNFSLSFEDFDNNSLFSIDELQASSFSGFTFNVVNFVPRLAEVPSIPGISTGGSVWVFTNIQQDSIVRGGVSLWTYALRELEPPVTVPEPTTLSLLGLSLAGLAWKTRRQRG